MLFFFSLSPQWEEEKKKEEKKYIRFSVIKIFYLLFCHPIVFSSSLVIDTFFLRFFKHFHYSDDGFFSSLIFGLNLFRFLI